MTADIVELDSVLVEVVEDGQTELISFTVVGLGNSATSGVREQVPKLVGVLANTVGPADGLSTDTAAGPEPFLSFAGTEVHELLSKSGVVEGDGSHAAGGANAGNLITTVLGSASSP